MKISKWERIGVRVFDDQQMAQYQGGFKSVGADTRMICFSSGHTVVKYGGRSPKFKVHLGSMSRDVHSCTHWLRPRNSPPYPVFGLVLRGRYWSAKIDDISLKPPGSGGMHPCVHILLAWRLFFP
jgi:hypothetical protein